VKYWRCDGCGNRTDYTSCTYTGSTPPYRPLPGYCIGEKDNWYEVSKDEIEDSTFDINEKERELGLVNELIPCPDKE